MLSRVKAVGVALALLVLGGCAKSADEPAPNEGPAISAFAPPMKTATSDLAYVPNGGNEQRLDLYPVKAKGAPLLIFIHGGAWIGGDKRQYALLATRFNQEGLAVANVNYRLSTTDKIKSPTHVEDVAKAYAFLAANAKKYGYSATKIFVMGHSAGAHTAAMLATGSFLAQAGIEKPDLPRGFIGIEGIYDVPQLVKKWPGYRNWFIEKAFGPEKNWPAGSPTERPIAVAAPWLVIHSRGDELVDVPQSQKFVAHLKQQGVKADFYDKPTAGHEDTLRNIEAPENATAQAILAFIKKNE